MVPTIDNREADTGEAGHRSPRGRADGDDRRRKACRGPRDSTAGKLTAAKLVIVHLASVPGLPAAVPVVPTIDAGRRAGAFPVRVGLQTDRKMGDGKIKERRLVFW